LLVGSHFHLLIETIRPVVHEPRREAANLKEEEEAKRLVTEQAAREE
jgi:hypothetical protein